MGLRSGRVRVADLGFRVFGRAIHPDWFAVHAHRRVSLGGWTADVRLIEGGHAILWASGDARIAEILAGPDLVLPDDGLIHRTGLRGERGIDLHPFRAVDYQACVEVERLDPSVFAHVAEELTLDATPGDLFRRGKPAGRLDPAPVSRIHVEPRGRGLSVQSFHTFPGEFAVVRAQSLFEGRAPAPR